MLEELKIEQPLLGLVDSHCHLDPKYESNGQPAADIVLARARHAGVTGFMVVGVGQTLAEANHAIELTCQHKDVVAALGIHPHDAQLMTQNMFDELSLLAENSNVAAIGEMGLDFHYEHSPREIQRSVFRHLIGLARKVQKPIVIHTRQAGQESLDILQEEHANEVGGVIHCFTEDLAFARRALDLNFDISFSGILTFKSSHALREVAQWLPNDRILVETDAPYLAPVPMRGSMCEPAMIVHTARAIATLRNTSPEDFALCTAQNTYRRFTTFKQR